MKKILVNLLLLGIAMPTLVMGQTPHEALEYSDLSAGGTARSVALGGAMGAVGGDIGAITTNPAGLGIYRKGEIVLSPGLHLNTSQVDYLGTNSNEQAARAYLSNFGLVFSKAAQNDQKAWKGLSLAVGSNRLKNYNNKTLLDGYNSYNSITDYYAESAAGIDPNTFSTSNVYDPDLAWQAYAIDPSNNGDNTYVGVASGGNVQQTEYTKTRGGVDELFVAFASNYKDRVYLGGSLGIPSIRRETQSLYRETDPLDSLPDFSELVLNEKLVTTGNAINVKLGAIVRINNIIRVGASVHSPNFYNLNDSFDTDLSTTLSNGENSFTAPTRVFEYKVRSPWRFIGSGTAIIPKYGFISLDYEFVNYKQMNFDFDSGYVEDIAFAKSLNTEIDNLFKAASNVRIGAEGVVDVFRLRLGYAYYGSPYADNSDLARQAVSGGVGVRFKKAYIDLAVAHQWSKIYYSPYTLPSNIPQATIRNSSTPVVLTLGLGF